MANPIRSAFDGCGALLPGETTARRVTLAILLLAVLLRALLVIANVQANDDHLGVIRIIAHEHRFPEPHEDWEAFQPKLYHTTVAAVLQILPSLPIGIEYRVAQAVSAAAGIATLLVLLAFLKRFELSERARLWTFGLVALNPKMISTSIQATNDAFVIFFASAAIFAAWRFFSSGTTASLAATTGFAILAAISKGNGLVLAIAVVCLFLGLLAHPDERLGLSRTALASRLVGFLLVFVVFVAPLGGYAGNYAREGTPFVLNVEPAPPPALFEESVAERPGVTSIAHAYGTFRLLSMLKMPMITGDHDDYVRHRTSVWSQLYGRMHFIHFDGWPPAWRDRSPAAIWLGRALLLAALLPSAFLVIGVVRRIAMSATWLRTGPTEAFTSADLFLAICMVGYLGFVMAYGYRYRDFATLKAIFVYPGLLAFAQVFALELDRLFRSHSERVVTTLRGCVVVLGVLYAVDASMLVRQLFKELLGG